MKTILIFCIFFVAATLVAQTQQEEVQVTTIQVWVKADRGGKPVPGLTINDFEIEEDGKKMASTCFEEFVLPSTDVPSSSESAEAEETSDASSSGGKRFAIFFDQLSTSEVEFQYMQSRLDDFLNQLDGKKLEVMLAAYPPYERVVPFTKDISEVRTQLEMLSGTLHRDQEMILKRRQIINLLTKRPQNAQWIAEAMRIALQYQSEEIAQIRSVLEALEDFGSYLSELQQSEHTVIMLISGGLNIEPGRQYFELIRQEAGEEEQDLPLGGMRGTGWDVRKEVRNTIAKLNLYNLTLYAINTRGPISVVNTTAESNRKFYPKDNEYLRDHQEMMDIMSEETGGISFRNSLNFKFGFNQVLQDLDHQYLICYTAPKHKESGEYHKIKVKTKAKGVDLRHRNGYID